MCDESKPSFLSCMARCVSQFANMPRSCKHLVAQCRLWAGGACSFGAHIDHF